MPEVQDEIGGDNRFVVFANETHVVGEGDSYGCASQIIRAFVTDPAALQRLDVSCAVAIPGIRAVGAYPADLAEVVPLTLAAGHASTTARRPAVWLSRSPAAMIASNIAGSTALSLSGRLSVTVQM